MVLLKSIYYVLLQHLLLSLLLLLLLQFIYIYLFFTAEHIRHCPSSLTTLWLVWQVYFIKMLYLVSIHFAPLII